MIAVGLLLAFLMFASMALASMIEELWPVWLGFALGATGSVMIVAGAL